MSRALRDEFLRAASDRHEGIAAAALAFARIEYPSLDPTPYLRRLDEMGRAGRAIVAAAEQSQPGPASRVTALTHYVYDELGFSGDREHYDDPRNSFLNAVLDRRSGIPISLAVVLIEVGERAGVPMEGVNFPGHFLVRLRAGGEGAPAHDLLIDPFHHGAVVSEADCYKLLRAHIGDEATLGTAMFQTAGKREILIRMLLNLKRAYVRLRSFPQARQVTELLVALDTGDLTELRDRGLLAYHLDDYSVALRDLQTYLRLGPQPTDDESRREHQQIWEHVKALRRRLASLN